MSDATLPHANALRVVISFAPDATPKQKAEQSGAIFQRLAQAAMDGKPLWSVQGERSAMMRVEYVRGRPSVEPRREPW